MITLVESLVELFQRLDFWKENKPERKVPLLFLPARLTELRVDPIFVWRVSACLRSALR